jgi:hypothetical protein
LQCFVLDSSLLLITLTCYFRVHRAGSQLKMSNDIKYEPCRQPTRASLRGSYLASTFIIYL